MMMKVFLIFFILMTALFGCTGNGEKEEPTHLNINIALDLSDRILRPNQVLFDTAYIHKIISIFENHLDTTHRFHLITKGKFNIFFYPPPSDTNVIRIAENLSIDFGEIDSTSVEGLRQKTSMFRSMDSIFMKNISDLYEYASKRPDYPGADIWALFHNGEIDKYIENDSSFRNILIILTDGYLYWETNTQKPKGNRYYNITSLSPQVTRFRDIMIENKYDWDSVFDRENYGFVSINKNLNNLEVLVLGIDPLNEKDLDIIKKYWFKWFREMKVDSTNIKILKTGWPGPQKDIENFFILY